jgi:hypothetical protein
MPDNPKVLGLLTERDGHRAALAWVSCMCYAGKHGTDGFIPREALSRVNARTQDAKLLVTHGFLVECPGGWNIHGWDEFQISSDEQKERKHRAQHAAAVRWSKSETRRRGTG